ncbi:efflux RND transporter periplasmic adaptor subunit [Flavobacterium sp. '19STA2R22 D10 B1']|uniref:efflux RND transporter periplasmic adaptor subunit n=1 Tax=Flavobacterium aerium TaxID=3037261 RepID=UPI00278C8B4E|nr:efflux RND transporter periplasmic adaptor subunit [Flavobacterium sp. '19STA2R22 D10 B1']
MKTKITIVLQRIGLSILTLFIFSCKKHVDDIPTVNYTIKDHVISLPPKSNLLSKLKTYTVAEESFRMEMTSTGTVKTIPNNYAEIAPPFSGRILKSFVRLGQVVQPGSPIFEMSSPDYFNAQKEYFDAKQEYKQAELNWKRQQDLFKNGVGIKQELEESETNYQTKKSAFSNADAALHVFNIDPSKSHLGQPLLVRSPIKGEIVSNNIVIGQYQKDDSSPIAIVAELSKVWIIGQVKEKDIRFIHELDEVEVKIAALPEQAIKGKVYHVNEIVDESTRSVEIIIECENKNKDLKPGMFVNVRFIDTPENTILIPEKAVLQFNDDAFVFVQTQPNSYTRRKIEVGDKNKGRIVVKSGLKPGEIIVSEGGIFLLEAK